MTATATVRVRVELVTALRELVDAVESLAVYPEGSFGFEDLAKAETAAKDALAAFDTGGSAASKKDA